MRLICTLQDQRQATILSSFLKNQGIDNELEMISNTDWGSSEYGTITCRIWVIDEDKMTSAQEFCEKFQENPNDLLFKPQESPTKLYLEPLQAKVKKVASLNSLSRPEEKTLIKPLGPLTYYFIMACSLLFVIQVFTTPPYVEHIPTTISYVPLFSSPIYKELVYDYPHAFELIDKIVSAFGIEKLQNPNDLPKEGKSLLEQYFSTPYWKGFYTYFLTSYPNWISVPRFEKIKEGEVWRLFTPALLHYDIFHILFNMIWLAVLGKQMEQRLMPFRYLAFILITGIFSNTCQYLMGGSNFIGFSGILCAMLVFIWVRQRKAPWEGYLLQSTTFNFLLIFILGMFFLQSLSFFLEKYAGTSISPGIANTAHLTGGLSGYLLGQLNYFAWKRS